jgi:hypothetical protein
MHSLSVASMSLAACSAGPLSRQIRIYDSRYAYLTGIYVPVPGTALDLRATSYQVMRMSSTHDTSLRTPAEESSVFLWSRQQKRDRQRIKPFSLGFGSTTNVFSLSSCTQRRNVVYRYHDTDTTPTSAGMFGARQGQEHHRVSSNWLW